MSFRGMFDRLKQRGFHFGGGGGNDSAMGQQYTFDPAAQRYEEKAMKKGGKVKSSASKRADGIAQRGKTRA